MWSDMYMCVWMNAYVSLCTCVCMVEWICDSYVQVNNYVSLDT